MTDALSWWEANDRFLGAALAWLRLRLTRAAGASAPVTDDDVASALRARDDAAGVVAEPALHQLADRLGLSAFERDVLLLCVASELDTGIPALCAAAAGQPSPTFALALTLFDDPAWDALSPDRPLRYWRLVEIAQSPGQPLTSSPLRADERVVNALKGMDHLDDRLSPLVEPVVGASRPLPPSQEALVVSGLRTLQRADAAARVPRLDLVGPDEQSRSAVAARIAHELGVPSYRLRVELLPTSSTELDLVSRLWHREALLAPVALSVETDHLDHHPQALTALASFLSRADGLVLLGSRDVRPDLPGPSYLLDVARPTASEQRALWTDALANHGSADVGALVAQFDLAQDAIQRIAEDAVADNDGCGLTSRLWDQCRRHARPRLDALAQRIEPVASWDQLVLPDHEIGLLRQIAAQVAQRERVYEDWGFAGRMNRGLGISALFAGESGTGKSMAAEVLATELSLDLYRIDLASVVSKYIGDTEKNLRQVFDAAEGGGAILFFDEADALFGKRSEVKDAHDRYANIEVNYLLQRMEAYRGLAVLATNMKSALDRAFVRRLRFIVTFPFPSVADRARMWSRVFPTGSPVDGLDVARLARLNLTGAGIHNVALNAAFVAAASGGSIGMAEVLEAARHELRKLERPINEADFRVPSEVTS